MDSNHKSDTILLLAVAAVGTLIHILLNGQYGFHRDELDFIMSARQLDWGYVSYPPITPLFARIGLEIFGESLRGLRVLPAIAQGVVMILAGLMARDMGGKRNARLMTAIAVFISPISLMGGTRQTGPVLGKVLTFTGMLGGLMTNGIPNVPEVMDKISLSMPQGWAMHAWKLTLAGNTAGAILLPILILVILAALFFTVGLSLFRRRFI